MRGVRIIRRRFHCPDTIRLSEVGFRFAKFRPLTYALEERRDIV